MVLLMSTYMFSWRNKNNKSTFLLKKMRLIWSYANIITTYSTEAEKWTILNYKI